MKVFEIIAVTVGYKEQFETFHVERQTMEQAIGVVEMLLDKDFEIIGARMVKTTLVPCRKEVSP